MVARPSRRSPIGQYVRSAPQRQSAPTCPPPSPPARGRDGRREVDPAPMARLSTGSDLGDAGRSRCRRGTSERARREPEPMAGADAGAHRATAVEWRQHLDVDARDAEHRRASLDHVQPDSPASRTRRAAPRSAYRARTAQRRRSGGRSAGARPAPGRLGRSSVRDHDAAREPATEQGSSRLAPTRARRSSTSDPTRQRAATPPRAWSGGRLRCFGVRRRPAQHASAAPPANGPSRSLRPGSSERGVCGPCTGAGRRPRAARGPRGSCSAQAAAYITTREK